MSQLLQIRNSKLAIAGLALLIAGCAAPRESLLSFTERKYREMAHCVDVRIDEAIRRGNFTKSSYGPIMQACGSEYGSLRVARYGAKLPDIP